MLTLHLLDHALTGHVEATEGAIDAAYEVALAFLPVPAGGADPSIAVICCLKPRRLRYQRWC